MVYFQKAWKSARVYSSFQLLFLGELRDQPSHFRPRHKYSSSAVFNRYQPFIFSIKVAVIELNSSRIAFLSEAKRDCNRFSTCSFITASSLLSSRSRPKPTIPLTPRMTCRAERLLSCSSSKRNDHLSPPGIDTIAFVATHVTRVSKHCLSEYIIQRIRATHNQASRVACILATSQRMECSPLASH